MIVENGAVEKLKNRPRGEVAIIDPKEFKFDATKITVFDLEDLNTMIKELRYRDAVALIKRSLVRLPWGDPDDLETFRRTRREWDVLLEAYIRAATDTGE